MSFRLTYATMFDPPELMHERFDTALGTVCAGLGARHALFVNGADVPAAHSALRRSPIDHDRVLGECAVASCDDADRAMRAAQSAFPAWRATAVAARLRLMRRIADILESRVYEIAAALARHASLQRKNSPPHSGPFREMSSTATSRSR